MIINNYDPFVKDFNDNKHLRVENVEQLIADDYKILREFITTHQRIQVKRLSMLDNYTKGRNNTITRRKRVNKYSTNLRLAHNFGKLFVNFDTGYNVTEPIKITSNDESKQKEIDRFTELNNIQSLDTQLWYDVSKYGRAYELHYLSNSEHKVILSNPFRTFVIYDLSIEKKPIAAVRYRIKDGQYNGVNVFTEAKDVINVHLYLEEEIIEFQKDKNTALKAINKYKHGFKSLPVIEFTSDRYRMGVFEDLIPLIDAYDAVESDIANYSEDSANALLVVKGLKIEDYLNLSDDDIANQYSQILEDYKQANMLSISDTVVDGCVQKAEAYYIYKQYDVSGMEAYKSRLIKNIFTIANIPNLMDENFSGNSSGVAMKYKLLGLRQYSGLRQNNFNKGLTARYNLVCSEANQSYKFYYSENLPTDDIDILEKLTRSGTEFSQETKLKLAPFVKDVEREVEKIQEHKQRQMMDLIGVKEVKDA